MIRFLPNFLSATLCLIFLSCSTNKELSQIEADLLALEWERLGNDIINMQKDHLVLISQSNKITKIISPSGSQYVNGGYFSNDSLNNIIFGFHRSLIDLQDSTNKIYKKYMDERKSFSIYHRRIKSNELQSDKNAMLKSHYYGVIRQLDKSVTNIRNRLTSTIDGYNSAIAILIETSSNGYQLAGNRLKIR